MVEYKPIPIGIEDFKEIRTCSHRRYVRIFEHNFAENKTKICRRADARQEFLTLLSAKFAKKTWLYSYENKFL